MSEWERTQDVIAALVLEGVLSAEQYENARRRLEVWTEPGQLAADTARVYEERKALVLAQRSAPSPETGT